MCFDSNTSHLTPFEILFFDFLFQTYRKALSGQVHIPDHFTVVVANLIKKLLHTDQSKRLGRTVGGTTAIMCHRWFANFDWVSNAYFPNLCVIILVILSYLQLISIIHFASS